MFTVRRVSNKLDFPGIYNFEEISVKEFGLKKVFLFFLGIPLLHFIYSSFADGIRF